MIESAVILDFEVLGKAVGKQRARIVRRGNFTVGVTPEKTVRYESLVRDEAFKKWGDKAPLQDALDMRVLIGCPIPVSYSGKKRAAALAGQIHPTVKPDMSNIVKAIEDALNAVVYRDDSQIVSQRLVKKFAETPSVRVQIRIHGAKCQ